MKNEIIPKNNINVDDTDHSIINALIQDGRMSFKAIGEMVNLTGDAVQERYNRLNNSGIVQVRGVADPRTLGFNVTAMIGLHVIGPVNTVVNELKKISNINLVACTFGTFDVIVEIVAANELSLFNLIEDSIRTIPNLSRVKVIRFIDILKWGYNPNKLLPSASKSEIKLTDEDNLILKVLFSNGRASYKEMAEMTGIPYANVRRRTISLIEEGIVIIQTSVNKAALSSTNTMAGILISISNQPIDSVVEQLFAIAQVEIIVSILGEYDLLIEIACDAIEELTRVIRIIRTIEGVFNTETFTYTKIDSLPIEWGTTLKRNII